MTISEQAANIFGEKHLRNRPFLVIKELARPSSGTKTEKKGWMDDSKNIARYEQPSIVDRINSKCLIESAIIIDLINRKMIKNRYETSTENDKLVEHYMEKYAEHITDGLRVWAQRSALNIAKKETANG